jgi:2-dehydrotetronate isomerase
MPRFAANLTLMYNEHAFLDRFGAAAKDGFGAVEFLFPYEYPAETIAAVLREHKLRQVLFNAPPGDWKAGERGITALPGREAEFRAGFEQALQYAQALDCPRVHCMAGLMPAGADEVRMRALMRATYGANLTWAAQRAEQAGVEAIIEAIAGRNLPGYFLNLQEEAHAVAEEIGAPALKIMMDLYHCQVAEGDLSMKMRKYLGGEKTRVSHMQMASVPERHEPDEGEVNYDCLFALMDELGYAGWVGCEYFPRGGTTEGLGWFRKWRAG